jgi:hypothetical protein
LGRPGSFLPGGEDRGEVARGHILQTLPTLSKSAETTAAALEALFKQHGPPLVLKADNSFYAEVLSQLLKRHSVIPLLSPPGCPSYNGACEAGIGGLQTAIHIEAARWDRPERGAPEGAKLPWERGMAALGKEDANYSTTSRQKSVRHYVGATPMRLKASQPGNLGLRRG